MCVTCTVSSTRSPIRSSHTLLSPCHLFPALAKVMLQVLYKLKTAKVFERARTKEEKPSTDIVEEDPFAIQTLSWCPESRMLSVAGVSAHVIVYRFSKQEVTTEDVQVGPRSLSLLPKPLMAPLQLNGPLCFLYRPNFILDHRKIKPNHYF